MSDISREPRDTTEKNEEYKFIADYLDSLLDVGRGTQIPAEVLGGILEPIVSMRDYLTKNRFDFYRAATTAKVIQGEFRKYVERKEKDLPTAKREEFNEFTIFNEVTTKCNISQGDYTAVKRIIRIAYENFFKKYSDYWKMVYACRPDAWSSVEATVKCWANQITPREKLDKAAIKIQMWYRRYAVQKAMKKIYPDGIFGASYDKESINEKWNKAALCIQKKYRQHMEHRERVNIECEEESEEEEEKDVSAQERDEDADDSHDKKVIEKIQKPCPQFNMKKIKSNIRGMIAASISSREEEKEDLTDDKPGGFYQITVEWFDYDNPSDKEEYKVAYNLDTDAMTIEYLNEDETITVCLEAQYILDSEPISDESLEKNNLKSNTIDLLHSFGYKVGSDGLVEGIYVIMVEHFVEENGSLISEEKITYNVEDDQFTVERKTAKDGHLPKPKSSAKVAFDIRSSESDTIQVMKANLQGMIRSNPTASRDGVISFKTASLIEDGTSVEQEEEIKYTVDGERLLIEHKKKDGVVTNYEESLPLQGDDDTHAEVEFNAEAFESNILGIFHAISSAKNIEIGPVDLQSSQPEVTKIVDSQEQQTPETSKKDSDMQDENPLATPGKEIPIETVKTNIVGVLRALSSPPKEESGQSENVKSNLSYKIVIERYDGDGAKIGEEDEMSLGVDGSKIILEHSKKGGSPVKHEGSLSAEELPSLDVTIGQSVQFNAESLQQNLLELLQNISGAEKIDAGVFKIKITRDESPNGEVIATYNAQAGDLDLEHIDKDGKSTKLEKKA